MPGRLLPLGLAVASIASAAAATLPPVLDRPAPPSGRYPVTPVFSVRRVPAVTTRIVATARLRAELEAVVSDPSLGGARTCLTVSDPDGHLVFDHGAEAGMIPASVVKLLTAAAALARMGPDSTFSTEVRASAPLADDGAVGSLWLVGGGDPLLATADFAEAAGWHEPPRAYTSLETLADRVAGAGVRQVGRVLGDESRFDAQRYLPTWKPEYATAPEIGPQSALNLNEGFVQWRPRAVAAARPALNAAEVFARLLRERGVVVGSEGEGTAPARTATVAAIASPPLTKVIDVILQDSDNLASELVVKELGFRFGAGGTTRAGMEVVSGVTGATAGGGVVAVDGSGLDRGNRLSCAVVHRVLEAEGRDGALAAALPRSGHSGTLSRRFQGTPASESIRAKTGSLLGVVGLAGWVDGTDGRALRFSLMANDLAREALGVALQDRVAVTLARYPDGPSLAEVGPLPPTPAASGG